jgi:hypothetical protein
MDMNGNKHYVSVELDDELFNFLRKDAAATATVIIPFSNKSNSIVYNAVREFGERLQILEMNMAMETNRLNIAKRYVELHKGELWKSSRSKPVINRKTLDGSSKHGNAMASWEKFLEEI